MKAEYIERIYSGWLGKIIGIRLGAPIEGWTYDRIREVYGELTGYPVDYKDFAADDDSNGPLFFLRALEDKPTDRELEPQDVGEALLNYAPFEHSFFWWGGYGVSTEHTAYLNLRNGIKAPMSGSVEQNGAAVAEQIGGQIFIDSWGLVNPGKPERAAHMAAKAASATHGGNGIYGGMFVAACIAAAFEESDMEKILETGLAQIPADCEYTRAVRAVMDFYHAHPENWREGFAFVHDNFGYDRYPGNCHIIPNISAMIVALLYGHGNFSDTLNICNMCGWDTDCNVGNVGTIMGVKCGLEGIDYDKWRKPINDFLACGSVMGSMNIMDIPYGASYIAKLAYELDGEAAPENWQNAWAKGLDACHFEFSGSTHAMRYRVEAGPDQEERTRECALMHTTESAHSGSGALKIVAKPVESGDRVFVYKRTYYQPKHFHDSRYDPAFSPLVYPGQTVHASVSLPAYSNNADACIYVKEGHSGEILLGEKVTLVKGQWTELEYQIPVLEGGRIDEVGVRFLMTGECFLQFDFVGLLDDLYVDGGPDYSVDFANESVEVWPGLHREISQFTKVKGLSWLEDNRLHLSCADFAEMYTGSHTWEDYEASFAVTPLTGEHHMVNVRVKGAIRSYAAGFLPNGKFAILKNNNGCKVMAETDYSWKIGEEYVVTVRACGNQIEAAVGDVKLEITDEDRPYLSGAIGVSIEKGSHTAYRMIRVKAL